MDLRRPEILTATPSPVDTTALLNALDCVLDNGQSSATITTSLMPMRDRHSSPSPPSPPTGHSPEQLSSETEVNESMPLALVLSSLPGMETGEASSETDHQLAQRSSTATNGHSKARRWAQCEDRLFDDDGTGAGMPTVGADDYAIGLKIVVVGRSGAGKSSAIASLVQNRPIGPTDGIQTTIGVDFFNYELTRGGRKWTFTLWDTAGQERFRSIVNSYLRATHGVVGMVDMYDLQNRMANEPVDHVKGAMSATQMADQFAEKEFDVIFGEAFKPNRDAAMNSIVYESLRNRPLFLLMGNKVDRLVENPEDMPLRNSLKRICEERGGRFFDTSVPDGYNVKCAWGRMMLDLIDVVRDHEAKYGPPPLRSPSQSMGYDAFQTQVGLLRIVAGSEGEPLEARAQGNLQCRC